MTMKNNLAYARKAAAERGSKALRPIRFVDGRLEGPEFLTQAEVANLFNVRRETVWFWEKQGRIAGCKVGGDLKRYPRANVEKLIIEKVSK